MDRRVNTPSNYVLDDLKYVVERLRDPETGCPWDTQQNFESLQHYLLEEVYEVIDAISSKNFIGLKEELGDLLFQIIFLAQIGQERGLFDFDKVVDGLTKKLIDRHPHVFPNGLLTAIPSGQNKIPSSKLMDDWERKKIKKRQESGLQSVLDDVPSAMPALMRAGKLQKRASLLGLDWSNSENVLNKISEELDELKSEIEFSDSKSISMELGDLLFSCVNLARKLSVDPEKSLRQSNEKFSNRVKYIESLADFDKLKAMSAEKLNALWDNAKKNEDYYS